MGAVRRTRARFSVLAGSTLIFMVVACGGSHALECGDLDNNGQIGATDALLLLRRAVGQPERDLTCPVLATGQTACYDASGTEIACDSTGQDGELQHGSKRSFTDNGDGTITDHSTGLTWEVLTSDGSIHDVGNELTWTEAFADKVVALNGSEFAGHSDWRIPNITELFTLVNLGAGSPATYFPFDSGCAPTCGAGTCSCTSSSRYWSTTSVDELADRGWAVNFAAGEIRAVDKGTRAGVRLVRAATSDVPTPDEPIVIAQGEAVFVDVFARGDDVWVVDRDKVRRFSSRGTLLDEWIAPRPLGAAALDGDYLVAVDAAAYTTLDAATLDFVASGTTVEWCTYVVALSNHRLVCGADSGFDRVYYTYDYLAAELLSSTFREHRDGAPIKKIPGQDAFVAVAEATNPSDFHLYRMDDARNEVVYINESPYHGGFQASSVFAYDASFAEFLITHEGLMMRISGSECSPSSNQCFIKEGHLGALSGSDFYVGMDNADRTVVGLVTFNQRGEQPCAPVCALQTIDVPSRDILSQQIFRIELGEVERLVTVADASYAVVAGHMPGSEPIGGPYFGYLVLGLEID